MPVFPIEPRYFLLDSFLPDVEMNFDLVILKTEALSLRPIVELVNICYDLPILYEILQCSC